MQSETISGRIFNAPFNVTVWYFTFSENLTSDDDYNDHWVTIFGFPAAASSYILEQFSQYGTILKHVVSGSG